MQREVPRDRTELCDGRAGFHGVRHQALVDQLDPGHMVGALEGLIGRGLVANFPIETGVTRRLRPKLRRGVFGGIFGGDDSWQHRIGYRDFFGGIPRNIQGGCNDDSDNVADEAHPALGQNRPRRFDHRFAVRLGDAPADRQPADLICRDFRPCQHLDHAVARLGGGDVDVAKFRMAVRRTDEGSVVLPADIYVVHIVAVTGKKTPIFFAQNACADSCVCHDRVLPGATGLSIL